MAKDLEADIRWLDAVLSCQAYRNSRRFLHKQFLDDAVTEATGWGNTLPGWYFYYAYSFAAGERTRKARLCALERALGRLHGGASKQLRSDLRKSGFQAAQRAFEIALLSAGLSLPDSCNVQLNPRTAGRCNTDLSAEFSVRPLFIEATCFQQNKVVNLPKRGTALLGTNLTSKAIKRKFEEKQRQFSGKSPNCIFLGYVPDSDPLGKTIDELNCGMAADVIAEGQDRPLLSAVVIFRQRSSNWMFDREATWFNPRAKFPLCRCEQGGIDSLAQQIATFDHTS